MPDTTTTDVASTTDTQPTQATAEPEAVELKSIDTGVLSALKSQQQTETAPSSDGATPSDKTPDSHANPAGKGTTDADSAAGAQGADDSDDDDDDRRDRKLEPWMRKRLQRAEERARRQASAEILELIKSLGINPQQQAQQATAQPGQQVDNPGSSAPKTLADFDYDVEKYTAYQVQEAVKAALAERDAENERRKAEARAEAARQAFEKRKAEFEKRVGKGAWERIVTADVDVPQEVVDLLIGHDRDLDIAYHLVNHPDEIEQLRGKSRLEIARKLAAIEAKLSGTPGEELPPKTTQAPPPPPKVPTAGKAVKSIAEMSTEERIAEWRRQKQARRQA